MESHHAMSQMSRVFMIIMAHRKSVFDVSKSCISYTMSKIDDQQAQAFPRATKYGIIKCKIVDCVRRRRESSIRRWLKTVTKWEEIDMLHFHEVVRGTSHIHRKITSSRVKNIKQRERTRFDSIINLIWFRCWVNICIQLRFISDWKAKTRTTKQTNALYVEFFFALFSLLDWVAFSQYSSRKIRSCLFPDVSCTFCGWATSLLSLSIFGALKTRPNIKAEQWPNGRVFSTIQIIIYTPSMMLWSLRSDKGLSRGFYFFHSVIIAHSIASPWPFSFYIYRRSGEEEKRQLNDAPRCALSLTLYTYFCVTQNKKC